MLKELLQQVVEGQSLTLEQSERLFMAIFNGAADNQAQLGALLTALKNKGETAEEIAGAARVLRAKATPFRAPEGAIDVCGTGGDGLNTLNISTAVALVVAACGVPIAKHGNRAVSSASGSADVLEALGIKIDVKTEVMEECMERTNFAFLFAPQYHTAMRRVMDVRRMLGFRTIFNLVGPLANPAQVKRQLIGVSSDHLVQVFYNVSNLLELRSLVVCGPEGMDEFSVTGGHSTVLANFPLDISELLAVAHGVYTLKELTGGDAAHNARAMHALLLGDATGAYAEAVKLNAAAALLVSGKFTNAQQAYQAAAEAILSRKAYDLLADVIKITNSYEHEHA